MDKKLDLMNAITAHDATSNSRQILSHKKVQLLSFGVHITNGDYCFIGFGFVVSASNMSI